MRLIAKTGMERLLLCALLVLLLCSSAELWAQFKPASPANKGIVTGVLTDSSGTPLKGVSVKATQGRTGQVFTAITDEKGAYTLNLWQGFYEVQFSQKGYKTAAIQGVQVFGSDPLTISIKMLPAGVKDEVVAVRWQSSTESGDLDASLAKAVPLSARNYTQASGAAAGVDTQLVNATSLGINTQDVKVGSGMTNNYMTDGVSVAATAGQFADAPGIPNPDAIETHRVQPWSYSAGPERNAGAHVVVTTKSGSNDFHGSAFEFVRNNMFNANDFFLKQMEIANKLEQKQPDLKQNQFGFTFGGPVLKNKAYFFSSYQGSRQTNGIDQSGYAPNVQLPPLPNARSTDLATFKTQLGNVFCPTNHPEMASSFNNPYKTKNAIYGGMQVACDGSNISDVAARILLLQLPNGNYLIPGSGTGTFSSHPMTVPSSFQENQYILNTDYVISPKHKIVEKFFNSRSNQLINFTAGRSGLPGTPTTVVLMKTYGVVKLASTLSPTATNEFRISGQRNLLADTVHSPFKNSDVGITSNGATSGPASTLDGISVSGYFTAGGNGTWDANHVNQYQLADQIFWKYGRHSLRAGVEGDRRQWNTHVIGQSIGSLIFQSFADFLIGRPGCPPTATGCSAANPVVDGVATNGSSGFSNIYGSLGPTWNNAQVTSADGVYHSYRFSDYNFYIQDSYKAFRNLTVTYGIRWEYFSLPSDSTGNSTNFWISRANAWQAPGSGGTYAGYVVPENYSGATTPSAVFKNSRTNPIGKMAPLTNFAPRVAIAWEARKNMVVNAGYGWFYDRPDAWTMDQASQAMPPYAAPVGGVGSSNYAASFANPYGSYTAGSGWSALARSAGWDSVLRTANVSAGTSSNLMLTALSEDFSTPMTQKWSLEIQNKLPHGLSTSVAYYGGHSIHLVDTMRQYNTPELASPSNPLYGTITTNTAANAALRVPFLGIAPAGLSVTETQGSAKYNALQATVTQRFRYGMRVTGTYRFSKTLMTEGSIQSAMGLPVLLSNTAMDSNNSLNARQQYGPAVLAGNALQGMSAPQRLVLRYGWDSPWNFTGSKAAVLNGWGISGVTIMQAGTPLTAIDTNGGTAYGGAGISRAQFCDGSGPQNAASSGSDFSRINGWFNTSAFCDTPKVANGDGKATDFGNSPVGFMRGPKQNVTDMSVTKHFNFTEKAKLDFRTEFYNAFNHANFANPSLNRADFIFGKITACSTNPRIIQFGLKLNY